MLVCYLDQLICLDSKLEMITENSFLLVVYKKKWFKRLILHVFRKMFMWIIYISPCFRSYNGTQRLLKIFATSIWFMTLLYFLPSFWLYNFFQTNFFHKSIFHYNWFWRPGVINGLVFNFSLYLPVYFERSMSITNIIDFA